jgi:hypothetical protein
MLHWRLVRQRALAKQSHRTGGGNEVRTLAKQIHAAALDERPPRYAPSGTAKQSHRRPKSPSTLPPFTRAILAKRNTPFYASEIRALQRGFRAGSFAADWHCQHIVMAELVLIGAKIKGPRAFCSLVPLLPSGRLRSSPSKTGVNALSSATGYGEVGVRGADFPHAQTRGEAPSPAPTLSSTACGWRIGWGRPLPASGAR